MIKFCLSECRVDGIVLEFGVMSGASIRHIANNTSSPIFGFDSFEGLPERWIGPQLEVGTFTQSGLQKC